MMVLSLNTSAQVSNPYHINGNATQDNCNCYTLTHDEFNQAGSVWNIYKIDLTEPFDFKFNVNLGSRDGDGADGIVFILQPVSTSLGSVGEGIGFSGIIPSIGVAIDTWMNNNLNDPVYDHISIHRDGNLDHLSPNNLAGPVTALEGSYNIEDGNWHLLRIVWDPAGKKLTAYMDNVERVSADIDLINDVFKGDPMVFWGFTAATGGARNTQRFCTALNAGFGFPPGQLTCFGNPIQFIDSSSSFGSIVKWFWDFGDGTTDTVPSPPIKNYAAPGIYHATLNILGNNGCLSETYAQDIVVGSDPIVSFSSNPPQVCEGPPIQLLDESTVEYGTIDKWNWTINGNTLTEKDPSFSLDGINKLDVSLRVGTKEGCTSDLLSKSFNVLPTPEIDFDFVSDLACTGNPIPLAAQNLTPSQSIDRWTWDLGDGRIDSSGKDLSVFYSVGGDYSIQLQARASNGCPSLPVTKPVMVYETNAYAGKDTILAMGQPLQLNGSGGEIYSWTPALGLSATNIPDPIATPDRDISYILTASVPVGCSTKDTIHIKVYKGPEIYVPTAFTPNHDGLNDELHIVPVGISLEYFKIYDRWGHLVFSTTDYRRGWDGSVNGKEPATGTFVWMAKGKDFLNQDVLKKGTTTIIR